MAPGSESPVTQIGLARESERATHQPIENRPLALSRFCCCYPIRSLPFMLFPSTSGSQRFPNWTGFAIQPASILLLRYAHRHLCERYTVKRERSPSTRSPDIYFTPLRVIQNMRFWLFLFSLYPFIEISYDIYFYANWTFRWNCNSEWVGPIEILANREEPRGVNREK